jgi:uncharacterized protein (UPF0335 family)
MALDVQETRDRLRKAQARFNTVESEINGYKRDVQKIADRLAAMGHDVTSVAEISAIIVAKQQEKAVAERELEETIKSGEMEVQTMEANLANAS